MIEEYYPSTTIDTELLVKSAMKEVEKKQNQVLFDALKRSRSNSWHREKPPLVYQAQSLDDIYLLIKL